MARFRADVPQPPAVLVAKTKVPAIAQQKASRLHRALHVLPTIQYSLSGFGIRVNGQAEAAALGAKTATSRGRAGSPASYAFWSSSS